ncbi:cellular calcium ion homeostasis [Homalodisca vitripennis]|nr:cellular calcium ion homeostasis [Homalodisca vitripennis]
MSNQQKKEMNDAIVESDELFESNKYQEATSALLPFKDINDVEVLWRISRAQYKASQSSSVSDAEKRQMIQEAYDSITKAMELNDSHWAVHKWMSVLLDAQSSYDGIKARVTQLENVKRHMLKAVELNPTDATTHYMLGSWCYQIADMSWIQRKIAATIFAAPPTSTFEEALHFFSKAEEIEPRFYSQNLLMLGKTLLKLQKPKEAAQYLTLARDYPSSSEEDNTCLLNSMSIRNVLNHICQHRDESSNKEIVERLPEYSGMCSRNVASQDQAISHIVSYILYGLQSGSEHDRQRQDNCNFNMEYNKKNSVLQGWRELNRVVTLNPRLKNGSEPKSNKDGLGHSHPMSSVASDRIFRMGKVKGRGYILSRFHEEEVVSQSCYFGRSDASHAVIFILATTFEPIYQQFYPGHL